MNHYSEFKSLHEAKEPLILGNAWNVQSAKALENAGYKALGTSSAAIAHSLGYNDGEEMAFEDYLFVIERICSSSKLPVSVDLEAGYGKDAQQIFNNIVTLSKLGLVGINIEDSLVENGERKLVDAGVFSDIIKEIMREIKADSMEMFVNVRSDVFLLNAENALEEAKKRIKLYESAEADGIFLPCLTDVGQIHELTGFTGLPVNLMCMPDLPDFSKLAQLGVKRISSGNFLNDFLYKDLQTTASKILEQNHFDLLFHE